MMRSLSAALAALSLVWPAQAQPPPSKQLPPTITLPSDLVTEIALYLQERPYREVAGLLGALQQVIAEQTRQADQSAAPGASPTVPSGPVQATH